MKTAFWKSKRVTLTGGSGFLGSHIATLLKEMGCRNLFIPRRREFDLRQREAVVRMYKKSRPEILIHAAAVVGGIGANRRAPGTFLYDNAIMGLQVIEMARQFGVKKFVLIGTTCSYPKFTPVPFKEEDLWNGYPEETNAPYGIAKKVLIAQIQAYRKQYPDFHGISLIPVNLFGPGDNFNLQTSHVIPAMVRKFSEATEKKKKQVTLWGTGTPTREFLYVEDCAEGIVMAAEKYDSLEPVNLGSGLEISIKNLAEKIADLIGFKGEILWDASQPDGQPKRRLDTSKAVAGFGFRARTPLEVGLEKTIRWYRLNRSSIEREKELDACAVLQE
ncbi:MAG: GDP-L-fucose synthase [Candidatus Omnitrophica bacterium]|nr:GDP-L-fucose synthase [Candidatus Omnitrophota bacterium]